MAVGLKALSWKVHYGMPRRPSFTLSVIPLNLTQVHISHTIRSLSFSSDTHVTLKGEDRETLVLLMGTQVFGSYIVGIIQNCLIIGFIQYVRLVLGIHYALHKVPSNLLRETL